ncbi:hypothetical protein [Clostridium algidicarnis]|uniref:hypothetical protein n=1 Tax=Clostridium algidicarnis TaxID=37659 RepID=UPI0016264305|nr:hypothetical protein [Clostridium algidicarnis]MBB6697275.1 hypothetical protein [Clostridium algidicarnis]
MEIKICGKFTKRKGYIYRTDTYFQIGQPENVKGAFILCNPGSSSFEDPEKQKKLEGYEGEDDYIDTGKLKADPVMKQLINILKVSGLDKEEGRFPIYNTFTLRNGNMDSAIKDFNDTNMDKELLHKDFYDFIDNKDRIPWTIVGWGCKDNRRLNSIKRGWLDYLNTKEVNFIGYEHKKSPHYYHPRPHIKEKQEEYLEIITKKLKNLLEGKNN